MKATVLKTVESLVCHLITDTHKWKEMLLYQAIGHVSYVKT